MTLLDVRAFRIALSVTVACGNLLSRSINVQLEFRKIIDE
ncbi:hypothetical protein OKW26_003543 [Paraburkholderia sp. 32]